MDVAVGLRHHPPDRVAPLADDVGVVCVAHIHLHGDAAAGGGVQHLRDQHLGSLHPLLLPAYPDMRVLLALGSNLERKSTVN